MTYPGKTKAVALLMQWQVQHHKLEKLMDGVRESIGLDIEGPMVDTVWKLFDAYTEALAHQVGDHGRWLHWFHGDNDMGGSGHEAGYDGQLKPIKTLGDLYDLIVESRGRAAT